MKKYLLTLLCTMFACSTLAACGAISSSSSQPSSTPSSSEEPSSEVPSSEEPSSEIPSSSEEPSSEIPSSEEPSYTSEEIIALALGSVKQNSHKLRIEETLTITYPNEKYAVDLYQKHELDLGYYYSEYGEISHSNKIKGTFADLIKNTTEINETTLKIKEGVETLYFRDDETGYAYVEFVDYENIVNVQTVVIEDMSAEDEEEVFVPILFDEYFPNPFDYIAEDDFTYVDDNTLTLEAGKAKMVLEYYGAVGVNNITSATITLDDSYRLASIELEAEDETNGYYVRTNEFSVEYYGYEEAEFKHVEPFTNENPALDAMFEKYTGLTNYTYVKEIEMNGEFDDRTEGYYTTDVVFFHHGTINDDEPATYTDDYDYKCLLNEQGIYDVYEYTYNDNDTYSWKQIWASPERPYTVETFEEIGPQFYNISTAIFKSIGNNQYTVEESLLPGIGKFFDFGVLGVQSYILESACNGFTITIDDDNNFVDVEITSYFQATDYVFNFSFENIGTTVIPEWVDGKVE